MGIKVKNSDSVHAAKKEWQRERLAELTKNVVERADELCVAREKFETETLARSNKELYGILSEVYGLFKRAVADECLKETVAAMKTALTARGIRVQVNTPALTLFVRYVFNSDRKRAYNYASTLMAAAQADVEPADLAEFIESKNGVEECKKEFRKKEETVKKEAAVAGAVVSVLEDLRTMQAQEVVTLADTDVELAEGTQFAFVVARVAGNGTLELLQVVSKTTVGMENAAIKELAKQHIAKKAAEVKAELLTRDKAATSAAAASLTLRELELA